MAPRPSTMKAPIVIAVFRGNNCSILRVCGYGWQRNCDRVQSSQSDKKCAHVFLLIGDYPPVSERRGDRRSVFTEAYSEWKCHFGAAMSDHHR